MIKKIDQDYVLIQSALNQHVLEIQGGIDAEGVGVVQNNNY